MSIRTQDLEIPLEEGINQVLSDKTKLKVPFLKTIENLIANKKGELTNDEGLEKIGNLQQAQHIFSIRDKVGGITENSIQLTNAFLKFQKKGALEP